MRSLHSERYIRITSLTCISDDCIYDDRQINSLRHAYNAGHMIGSHTWAHLDLSQQSWDKSKHFLPDIQA